MISCDMFRKKTEDYIRHEVTNDMEEALHSHMESCPRCKEYFEEEEKLHKAFKEVINNNIEFKSLRCDILNSVDKNRYGKNPKARLHLNILRHKKLYSGLSVACLLFMLISIKGGFNGFKGSDFYNGVVALKESSSKSTSQKSIANTPTDSALNEGDQKSDLKDNSTDASNKQTDNAQILPQFKKEILLEIKNPSFNMPWKTSPNQLLSASILDKGEEAQEEGIAKIGVRNNKTGEMWQFSVIADGKQFSPKSLEWWDDDSVLLIYGYGYGTITRGGDLYLMNMNTGKISFIYSTGSKFSEVTKANRANNGIEMLINVYDDDSMSTEKSHVESGIIKEYKEGQEVVVERKMIKGN